MISKKSTDAEVLFQKLGNTWYAFTQINDEVIYSTLPEGIDPLTTRLELISVVEDHIKKISKAHSKKRRALAAA